MRAALQSSLMQRLTIMTTWSPPVPLYHRQIPAFVNGAVFKQFTPFSISYIFCFITSISLYSHSFPQLSSPSPSSLLYLLSLSLLLIVPSLSLPPPYCTFSPSPSSLLYLLSLSLLLIVPSLSLPPPYCTFSPSPSHHGKT